MRKGGSVLDLVSAGFTTYLIFKRDAERGETS